MEYTIRDGKIHVFPPSLDDVKMIAEANKKSVWDGSRYYPIMKRCRSYKIQFTDAPEAQVPTDFKQWVCLNDDKKAFYESYINGIMYRNKDKEIVIVDSPNVCEECHNVKFFSDRVGYKVIRNFIAYQTKNEEMLKHLTWNDKQDIYFQHNLLRRCRKCNYYQCVSCKKRAFSCRCRFASIVEQKNTIKQFKKFKH